MSRKKGRGFRGERRQETSVDRGGQFSFSGAKEDSVLPIRAINDEAKRFDIHSVIGTGWIHTHGMAEAAIRTSRYGVCRTFWPRRLLN